MTDPIVSVEQGKLLGRTSTNIHGGIFYSFQGIPYAKPPLGELRFKAPQAPDSWLGIRDSTVEGSECYSRHMVFRNLVGSEDCLFLNVYTPQFSMKDSVSLKPVMIWIHGGGFRSGSSKTDLYGPEYLLLEDIVLVTINYRLGILGFLNFEDASLGVPGNAGLKDIVMALKWIKTNINNFGGDSNNVTIFGESAGAAAVHYLILSPTTKGLFHKAIAQSGCALSCFARGKNITSYLASLLELPFTNEKEILQHLTGLPIKELFELSEKILDLCDVYTNSGERRPYAPVIEKPSEEAFLTEEPIKIINSGNYNKVPLIFGYNTREGMLMEVMIKPHKPEVPKNFENIIPFMLEVERGSEASKAIANKIKQFYYGEQGSEDQIDNFYLLHTDNYFLRDIICATKHHAATSSFPVYLYRMSVETSLNIFKKLFNINTGGVCHGDDLGYLFKTKVSPKLLSGSAEEMSVKRFVKYWTNFAKFGNPNGNYNDEKNSIQWKPVIKPELNFMDFGTLLTTGVNPEAERMQFWNEIFSSNPLYTIW